MSVSVPSKVAVSSASPVLAAPQSTAVITPTGTLNITLAPTPTPTIPIYQNPTSLVAIATLIGVGLTIYFGWRKTKMELAAASEQATLERNQSREQANLDRQHAAEQAQLERISQARREVYLEVLQEMVAAQSAIALLTTQDIQHLDVESKTRGLIAAVSKVSLFGEIKTVEKSWELLNALHEGLFRLMAHLVPYNTQKWVAENLDQKAKSDIAAINKLNADIQVVLANSKNLAERDRVSKLQESSLADIETRGAEAIAAKIALLRLQEAYSDAVTQEAFKIGKKIDELVMCIRAELALETSLDSFHAMREKAHEAVLAATSELRSKLNEDFNGDLN